MPGSFATFRLSPLPHFQQKTGGYTGEENVPELIIRQLLWISLLRWPPVVFCDAGIAPTSIIIRIGRCDVKKNRADFRGNFGPVFLTAVLLRSAI